MDNNLSDEKVHPMNPSKGKTSLRIGELLVMEGFLTKQDLQQALAIQQAEKELVKLPLGQILIKMKVLSETDLESLLNHSDIRRNIGTMAVEKGFIEKEQLELCLKNKGANQMTGEFLVKQGLLTQDQVGQLLREQVNSPKLGELAIKLRVISEKDLEVALRAQKSPRALGEILCDLNFVTPMDLNYVLNKYNKQLSLEKILLNLGYLDEAKLNLARQEQAHGTASLGQILIQKKLLTTEQLCFALSKKYNLPFRHFNDFVYSGEDKKVLSGIISQKYAEKHMVLPISLEGGDHLTIAVFDPEKIHVTNELKRIFGHLKISCVLVTEEKFEGLFEILYSKRLSSGLGKNEESGSSENINFMEIDLEEEFAGNEEAPVYDARDIEGEELVNFIIKDGILKGASDIHLEQDRHGAKLRYRIDGILHEANVAWLKKKLQEKIGAVVSRIKVMSNLDIAERRIPQDGVFRINYYDKTKNQKFDLDFRVATCRAIAGENVTIRILDSRKANVGLENLSHSPHVLEPFKTLLKSSAGMILVSGPTGSGKSSTLYGALQFVYNPGIKIITAEDPIEYSFPGIMQTQIQPKINLTFARLLRSFLRLDPDVILVGEIRDGETASIGFDAAQTGHLLLSTIHTNDAISAIPRLLDLEIDKGQIASCLMGVLAQRLVRKICPSCIKEYVIDDDEWMKIFKNYPSHLTFYKGQGCEACDFTGYKGRILLSEIFIIDKEIAMALNRSFDENNIRRLAVASGMKSMLEDGLLKLQETTLSEILRVIPHDMIKEYRLRQEAQGMVDLMYQQQDKTDFTMSEGDLLPDSFSLSDPAAEKQLIGQLYSQFVSLNSEEGSMADPQALNIFQEFITESFQQLCQTYQCRSVTFTVSGQKGKPEISAIPMM